MKKNGITATTATYVLIGVCALLGLSAIGGGLFAASQLRAQSVVATHAVIDADISNGDTTRVLALDKYLKDNAGVIDQTAQIASSIGQYQQNTIIATIGSYAQKAGVSVTGYNFGSTPAAAVPASGATAGGIDLTIGSPVAYRNFIVFLKLLENGVMPVTVTSATISPTSANGSDISVSGMNIKVTN